jgi:NitT/TauT family transport system substrate-binding protein
VKTQRALQADPSLAKKAAERLFPAEEADMIARLVELDAPFYQATITEDAVAGAAEFARAAGLITGPVRYEDVVATQFRDLWTE